MFINDSMVVLFHGKEIDPHRRVHAVFAHGLGQQKRDVLRAVISVMHVSFGIVCSS
jgi:hypothetical protein